MADFVDVESTLASMIAASIYPDGVPTPLPSPAPSGVNGAPTRIFRGWPAGAQLDADMAAGVVDVSIYSQMNIERNTTRFPREYLTAVQPVHQATATVLHDTVTIGGTLASPNWIMIGVGSVEAPKFYSYAIQANDTPSTAAAALASLIATDFAGTTSSGAVITVAGPVIAARVGSQATLWRELRRQMRGFQITIWAPSDALRTATARVIDTMFAGVEFIALPDYSAGRLLYEASHEIDTSQLVKVYRRDLFYSVDFPTTEVLTGYEVTGPLVTVTRLYQ